MPLGDSVWFPRSVRRAKILVVVIIMTLLHQSELVGLMDAGLLFGWLPVQLAYDVLFLLVGVIILYWVATIIPDTDEYILESQERESATVEPSDLSEE